MSDAVLIALIVAIPPTIIAIANLLQARKNARVTRNYHRAVDGKMTKLLKATAGAARAEGKLEALSPAPPPPPPAPAPQPPS